VRRVRTRFLCALVLISWRPPFPRPELPSFVVSTEFNPGKHNLFLFLPFAESGFLPQRDFFMCWTRFFFDLTLPPCPKHFFPVWAKTGSLSSCFESLGHSKVVGPGSPIVGYLLRCAFPPFPSKYFLLLFLIRWGVFDTRCGYFFFFWLGLRPPLFFLTSGAFRPTTTTEAQSVRSPFPPPPCPGLLKMCSVHLYSVSVIFNLRSKF